MIDCDHTSLGRALRDRSSGAVGDVAPSPAAVRARAGSGRFWRRRSPGFIEITRSDLVYHFVDRRFRVPITTILTVEQHGTVLAVSHAGEHTGGRLIHTECDLDAPMAFLMAEEITRRAGLR